MLLEKSVLRSLGKTGVGGLVVGVVLLKTRSSRDPQNALLGDT